MVRITVVIPTFHRVRQLSRLIGSFSAQSLPQDQYEILVVSNFPDRELRLAIDPLARTQANVRVIETGAKGANLSRNRGIQEGVGDILLFLDDDCILHDGQYLERVLEQHEIHKNTLAVGGSYSIPDGCRLADVAYNLISQEWQAKGVVPGDNETLRLLGGNVSYKRSALLEAGELFNPDITYGGAELEFHARLAKRGARLVLEPSLSVHHLPEIKGGDLVKKAYKQAMTTVQFAIDDQDKNHADGRQSLRTVMALRYASSEQEMLTICRLMAQYDHAYNLVAQGGVRSVFGLRLKVGSWAGINAFEGSVTPNE
jgi:glycosyltransferase involved in cell wall biosynthesis